MDGFSRKCWLLVLCVLIACGRPAPGPVERADINLVLVIMCTVRADQSSLHGVPGTTPTLKDIAARGTWLSQHIATAPWTRASASSILTGHTPAETGIAGLEGGPNNRAVAPSVDLLSEHLAARGWHAVGVTANPNLNARFGFSRGFTSYRELSEPWRHGMNKPSGAEVNEQVFSLVDQAPRNTPIYVQAVYVDAHAPDDSTALERRPFASPAISGEVASYRAMLRRLDRHLETLLRGLARRGLTADNTVFAFVSDHGEGLRTPNPDIDGHGLFLYPDAVHVPALFMGRGVPTGKQIDGITSGVDVLPTLLQLLSLDVEELPGRDVLAEVPSQSSEAFSATWFRNARRGARYGPDSACFVDLAPNIPPRVGKQHPPPLIGCFEHRNLALGAPRENESARPLRRWLREQESRFPPPTIVGPGGSPGEAGLLEVLGYMDGPTTP